MVARNTNFTAGLSVFAPSRSRPGRFLEAADQIGRQAAGVAPGW